MTEKIKTHAGGPHISGSITSIYKEKEDELKSVGSSPTVVV
jgi:hypothetical protein